MMRQSDNQSVEDLADATVKALPEIPIEPAFAARTLRVARGELLLQRSGRLGQMTRFVGRLAIPLALVGCALGYAYHYIQVAEHVYVSHTSP